MFLADGTCVDGRYTVLSKVGQGKAGGAVYKASDGRSPEAPPVALKYPVSEEELRALRALGEGESCCLGVPRLHCWGEHDGQPYAAMDLLGTTVMKALRGISQQALVVRWRAVAAIGRMLLRRLEAIHRRGLLHNDVQPENVLLAARRGGESSMGPFLIDYGWARPFPGGGDMKPYWGSVDYNSIHSVSGKERGPFDDLESLGWLLCHGLFGELPWFQLTKGTRWTRGRPERPSVCEDVGESKAALLACTSFGQGWAHLARLPQGLMDFLRACQLGASSAAAGDVLPDYAALAAHLGTEGVQGAGDLEAAADADAADLELLQRCCCVLLEVSRHDLRGAGGGRAAGAEHVLRRRERPAGAEAASRARRQPEGAHPCAARQWVELKRHEVPDEQDAEGLREGVPVDHPGRPRALGAPRGSSLPLPGGEERDREAARRRQAVRPVVAARRLRDVLEGRSVALGLHARERANRRHCVLLRQLPAGQQGHRRAPEDRTARALALGRHVQRCARPGALLLRSALLAARSLHPLARGASLPRAAGASPRAVPRSPGPRARRRLRLPRERAGGHRAV
mmetsp:Transcript_71351/g.220544  ORF Transcript_71351/g.220544 Transcript_71351/m.220544 type:complete len:570 (+) Transcript_71351:68-1777(+)